MKVHPVDEVPDDPSLGAALVARARAARAAGGRVVVARDPATGAAVGLIAFRESPWDAEGLSVKAVTTVDAFHARDVRVAERLADELDAFARERSSALDGLRVPAGDVAVLDALLRRGFGVVEPLLVLAREERDLPPPAPGRVRVRPVEESDLPALRRLAATAFPESRFSDPRGPRGWNELVYARWVDARFSQRGERMLFLIAVVDDGPAGFVTWKVHEAPGTTGLTGQVDLVAVEPRHRGRGVGRALFDEARRRSPPLARMAADVYARNPLGLALHQRYGLEVQETVLALHRWNGAP